MKIFTILLGYLAVTSNFNQATLASVIDVPGEIGHDAGNKVKQERRSDSDSLTTPEPGEMIEGRFAELAPPILVILAIVAAVTLSVVWVEGNNPKREAFTQNSVSQMSQNASSFNWVICHSPYSTNFDGTEGKDWGYTHHELGMAFGRTIGYDLYWARSGTFTNDGDGGFINWAYQGNVLSRDGGAVTFGTL